MSNCMGLKVQFDTVVNYMGCGQFVKMLVNSSYVDVDHFDKLHFDEPFDERIYELHFDKRIYELHFDERFDVNLAKRRKSQAEDRRCQDKFGTLPEKF